MHTISLERIGNTTVFSAMDARGGNFKKKI
jgi:hypothetical protein